MNLEVICSMNELTSDLVYKLDNSCHEAFNSFKVVMSAKRQLFNEFLAILYNGNKVVAIAAFSIEDVDNLVIHYLETAEDERGCGYGTYLIKTLVTRNHANLITGFIKNSYEAYAFWNHIAHIFNYELFIEDEDKPFLNEQDYDFEYNLYIEVK